MEAKEVTGERGPRRTVWVRLHTAVSRVLGRFWRPLLFCGVILGFLLGKALPNSHSSPLGIAFFVAVRSAGFSPLAALPVALAVIAGSAQALPLSEWLGVALALGLGQALATVVRARRNGTAQLTAALVASVISPIPILLSGVNLTPLWLFLSFWACLTGILALVFTLGLTQVASGKRLRLGRADSLVPLVVILAAALCGLQNVRLGPWFSLQDIAAGLLVLVGAYAGGAPLGAAVGGLVGISFLFSFLGDSPAQSQALSVMAQVGRTPEAMEATARSMVYVVSGLLSGTFRELQKAGVGLAFALGLATYALSTMTNDQQLWPLTTSAAAAVLLFWLMPRSWLVTVSAALSRSNESRALELSQTPGNAGALAERTLGVARALKEVSQTFEQVATVEAKSEPELTFQPVIERSCKRCSMKLPCWEKEHDRSYQLFSDLWQQIEANGPLPTQPAPEALRQHCLYPAQVASTMNYVNDLNRSRRLWTHQLDEGRALVVDYVKNVSRMLEQFADEVNQPGDMGGHEAVSSLRVVSGVAKIPKRGSHLSGDSYTSASLGANRHLLALSDGMGAGRQASIESQQCLALLQEMLSAGFATELAVHTVNSVLLLRAPEESFATVDMILMDLETGQSEFIKVGAVPSFIKRGEEITTVKKETVPAGIVSQVQVEPEFRSLRSGDIVVMVTDGVWEASREHADRERWLRQHLARETSTDPEEIAASLLAHAIELTHEVADDMTVLVARIDAEGAQVSQEQVQRVTTWVPARKAPQLNGSATDAGSRRGEKR